MWLCSVASFCSRDFLSVAMSLSPGACSRTSLLLEGWRVISNDPVVTESMSGLFGLVVKVVCLGCQLLGCGGEVGGFVIFFFRMGALRCV